MKSVFKIVYVRALKERYRGAEKKLLQTLQTQRESL